MHTTHKGDISVAALVLAFLRLGYIVLRPETDNIRYDLVIDRGNGFERVQCKTGRVVDGNVVVFSSSSRNQVTKKHRDYRGEADVFGVYCIELDRCFIVPISEAPLNECRLRMIEPKNGMKKKIRWGRDYLLEIK